MEKSVETDLCICAITLQFVGARFNKQKNKGNKRNDFSEIGQNTVLRHLLVKHNEIE